MPIDATQVVLPARFEAEYHSRNVAMDFKPLLRQRTQVTHMSFPGKDANSSRRKRVAGELDVLTIEGRDLTPFGRKHV